MPLESITCNHCGAPLEASTSTNFITCNHCGRQLVIRRTGGATYTEQLEEIDRRTERMAEQLDTLAQETELSRLDREWEQEREQYMMTGKHGRRYLPSATGSVVGGLIAAGFGAFWTVMAFAITRFAPFPLIGIIFPLFGILFIVAGLAAAYRGYHKAQGYEQAHRAYQQRRAELLERGKTD